MSIHIKLERHRGVSTCYTFNLLSKHVDLDIYARDKLNSIIHIVLLYNDLLKVIISFANKATPLTSVATITKLINSGISIDSLV